MQLIKANVLNGQFQQYLQYDGKKNITLVTGTETRSGTHFAFNCGFHQLRQPKTAEPPLTGNTLTKFILNTNIS